MSETIKIHVLRCGYVIVDSELPYSGSSKNPLAFTGFMRSKRHRLTLPVFAYYIEHPKGKILIDTGWNPSIMDDPKKQLSKLHYMINKPVINEDEGVDSQLLKQFGVKPSNLDYVILSHLHTDHVSGLKRVKDANKIIVNKTELKAAQKSLHYVQDMWGGVEIKPYEMKKSELGPKKMSYDVFGDSTVNLVWIPGHVPGLAATLIKNNGKFVLLTGDCGYSTKSWQEMILPGECSNKKDLVKSLSWVKEMSEKDNCVEVLACHDMGVEPHTVVI